ncbi:MAG: lytic murein transglycosylase [Thioalkalivibrionaceae bacterium]
MIVALLVSGCASAANTLPAESSSTIVAGTAKTSVESMIGPSPAAVAPAVRRGRAEDFPTCVAALAEQARQQGITSDAVVAVLDRAQWLDSVVSLDGRQPEFVTPFHEYFARAVSTQRVQIARARLSDHRDLFNRVSARDGVPAEILVALWGLETDFGRFLGRTDVASALATLACEGRRERLFVDELLALMQLVERGDVTLDQTVGSWAGAMGQMQFMPSVYLGYAVDGDGSGRRDLFTSLPDAMFSASRFLASLGWNRDEAWGQEVLLTPAFDWTRLRDDERLTRAEWALRGVMPAGTWRFPPEARLRFVAPAGHRGPIFLVGSNFDVILGWNRSEHYAVSVGVLADQAAGRPGLRVMPPTDVPRLTREHVVRLQEQLNANGFDAGAVDGLMGPRTRAAVRRQQAALGLIPDGQPDRMLLARLAID